MSSNNYVVIRSNDDGTFQVGVGMGDTNNVQFLPELHNTLSQALIDAVEIGTEYGVQAFYKKPVEVCADCGENAPTGHMECQYPRERN